MLDNKYSNLLNFLYFSFKKYKINTWCVGEDMGMGFGFGHERVSFTYYNKPRKFWDIGNEVISYMMPYFKVYFDQGWEWNLRVWDDLWCGDR